MYKAPLKQKSQDDHSHVGKEERLCYDTLAEEVALPNGMATTQ